MKKGEYMKTENSITLKAISSEKIVDIGQCMCPVNCVKKSKNNEVLTREVEKTYTLKRAA